MCMLNKFIGSFSASSTRTKVVVKNIAGSFFVKIASLVIQFALVPLTIDYIDSEQYGIWLSLSTIIGWVALFDLGFGHGLRNKIAENIAINNWELAQQYVSTAYMYMTIVFTPICLVAYLLCPLIEWHTLLNVNPEYEATMLRVMRIIIIFFAVTSVIKLQGTVLLALQKSALSALVDLGGQALTLVLTIALLYTTEGSLTYLAIVICISPIIAYIINSVWLYGFQFKKLRPQISLVKKSLVKDVLGLGVNFFIINIAVLVLFQTMNILISNVAGAEAVTEYNVVYKYLSLPLMISSLLTAPFWSAYTDAYAVRDYNWMKASYNKISKIFYLVAIILAVMVCVYPIVFKMWLGDKVEIHLSMVVVVTVYVLIMVVNQVNANIVNGIGTLRLQLLLSLLSTIGNIPLSLFLGRIYGAVGVVLSVAFFNLLPAIILRIQAIKLVNNTAKGIWLK